MYSSSDEEEAILFLAVEEECLRFVSFVEKIYVNKYHFVYLPLQIALRNTAKPAENAEELGENGDEIKKKWRNLRDTYAKYIRSTKTKTGQAATNTKKWLWADQMEGFRPFLNFAKTTSNVQDVHSEEYTVEINTEPDENEETSGIPETEESDFSQNPSTDIHLQPSTSKTFTPVVTPTSKPTHKDVSELRTPMKSIENRKRKSDPSTSVQYMMTYFDSKKKIELDAVDKLFLAHASTIKTFSARRQIEVKRKVVEVIMEHELFHLEESTSNYQTRPTSTDTYRSTSSIESTHPVASLGSSNDAVDSSQAYQMNSGPIYTTLTNQVYDPASTESSVSNYLNSFNPC